MVDDIHPLNLSPNTYTFAKNAVIEDFYEGKGYAIQNEPSNRFSVRFPPGYTVMGFREIHEQNRVVYILHNFETNITQFGEVRNCKREYHTDKIDKVFCKNCPQYKGDETNPLEQVDEQPYCNYELISTSACMNLNINYPIDIEYKITNCSLNIYFTDFINERRFLYFDYTNNDLNSNLLVQDRFKTQTGVNVNNCNQPIYINQVDCEKIKVNPDYKKPCITFNQFTSGGKLKEGTYQILIGYTDAYGELLTQYEPASHPIPLFTKKIKFDTAIETGASLSFIITNIETNSVFQYYNIVIAETIDQFTEFKIVATLPTTQNTYTYTGYENGIKRISAEQALFKSTYYKAAKGITKANDYLFYNGVKEYEVLNLQPIANKINLQWVTAAIKEGEYFNPKNTYLLKTNQRDEIYPYGIVFEFNNGRETCAFPLIGRAAQPSDLVNITNNDVISDDECPPIDNCIPCSNINGVAALSCSDNNCTEQGEVGLVFTFPQPTPTDFVIKIGAITKATQTNAIDAIGLSIFTPPTNLQPNGYYYTDPNATADVFVPAGTTSISFPLLYITGADPQSGRNLIECHNCLFPVVLIAFKAIAADNAHSINFTSPNNVIVINTPNTALTCQPDCSGSNPKWKTYNTGTIIGGDYEYTADCNDIKCWEWGSFSYWESTEKYPNIPEVWENLCGKPIRHFKFPDATISHIHDSKDGNKTFNDTNYIFPIGVKIDHEQVKTLLSNAVLTGLITQEQKNSIIGYRIVRGNRVGNKSIIAKGLLYNVWKYNKFNKNYYYSNYPYNSLQPDYFLSPVNNYEGSNTSPATPSIYDNENLRYTFHSPDIHFVNPKINGYLKLETEEYGQSEGYFTHSECQAKYKLLSTVARTLAFGLGLAAAISATGSKECKTLTTIRGSDITAGVTAGTTTHTPFLYTDSDNALQLPIPTLAYSETKNSCKGQAYQIFNTNLVINGALATVGTTGLIIQRVILGVLEMDKVIQTMQTLIPAKNYGIQYNSEGTYNNYSPVGNNGNKIRDLETSAYLNSSLQTVNESQASISFNNRDRESSLYLKIKGVKFPGTTHVDNSRVTLNNIGYGFNDLDKNFRRNIASYYAAIKRKIPNQYGQICNIEFLETNSCSFKLNQTYLPCQTKVFGGDTFLNRFALKRKIPFFLQTRCSLPDGSDVKYSELGNVAFPNYYFNSESALGEKILSVGGGGIGSILQDLLGTADSRMDAKTNKFFFQNGYIHLFNYGIPYFIVESDVNVDYRYGENNLDKDFYPNNKNLKYWFEEANVPIKVDNFYAYNKTYSKQNKESVICTSCIKEYRDLTCQSTNYNRLIYSEPSTTENKSDNWLHFKSNNYYDFPLSKGELISADGIENDKVIARLSMGTQIFPAYNQIQATENTIQVGTGGIFKQPPQDISTSDLGFAGTRHRDILHTEFGHIWADAPRGDVFLLPPGGNGLETISRDGKSSWFKENLPFQIIKDFPNYQFIDNNLNGIGLHYGYDKRFSRILITKLDYKVIDKNVKYDSVTGQFYTETTSVHSLPIRKIIQLNNIKYFCNKSWTISYNLKNKSWVSYHDYTPNYYVEKIDSFDGGYSFPIVQNNKLTVEKRQYTHNFTNKSYQVFGSKLYPFIIEYLTKPNSFNSILNSVEFTLDVIRFHNDFDTFYNRTKTFNKCIIYNNHQTTGLLEFEKENENDFYQKRQFPQRITNGIKILTSNRENIWKFNQFYNVAKSELNNLPLFNYKCNNVDKELNTLNLDYDKTDINQSPIRSQYCKIRLINDVESNYKFIMLLSQNNQTQSNS